MPQSRINRHRWRHSFLIFISALVILLFSATPAFALDAPTDFFGNNATADSIEWHWNDTSSDEDGFEIQDPGNSSKTDIGADNSSVVESGLDENTSYYRHCHAYTATPGSPQTVEIGGGLYTDYYPIDNYDTKYARSQALYLQSEINQAGTIREIKFDKYSTDSSFVNNCTIYLYETDDPTLSGWVQEPSGPGTLVYSGNLDIPTTTGWYTISLNTSFYYSNSKNLLFSFRHLNGIIESGMLTWSVSEKLNRCVAGYSDTDNTPDVTVKGYVPDVQFVMEDEIRVYGSPSNTNSACTLVHEPGDADLALSDWGGQQAKIMVTPPLNSTFGCTGVYIDRDNSAAFDEQPVVISNWAQKYTHIDLVPDPGTWYYRIRLRNQVGVMTQFYNESVTIVSPPIAPPSNLFGNNETTGSVTWHWTDQSSLENGFELHLIGTEDIVLDIGQEDAESAVEGLLDENTEYSRHCHAYEVVTGSTDNVTCLNSAWLSSYYPINVKYSSYYRSQMLYLHDEIAREGLIAKIRLYQDNSKTATINNFTIYMAETDETTLTEWIGDDNGAGMEVFSGTLVDVGGGGWVEITLATPFYYNNVANLLVSFRHQHGGTQNIDLQWTLFESSDNRCLYGYSTDTNPPPVQPAGSTVPIVPDIQFEIISAWKYRSPASNDNDACTLIHDPVDEDLSLTEIGGGMAWVAVTPPMNFDLGCTGVYIDRDTDINFGSPEMVSDWTQTYAMIDTPPGPDLYYYRITFRNQEGITTGTYNESVTISTVPLDEPTDFFGDSETSSSITWHWTDASTGEDGFELHNGSDMKIGEAGPDIISTVETGLDENTEYFRHCHAYKSFLHPNNSMEGFEPGELDGWMTGGWASWSASMSLPFSGDYSALSGSILDSEYTYLKKTYDMGTESGAVVKFQWKVSSEVDCDYLTFYINDVFKEEISGEVGWVQCTYPLGTDDNILKWEYYKNGSFSGGGDCGYLDEVEIIYPDIMHHSSSSNTNSACTLVHDPGDPDLALSEIGSGQVQIDIAQPLNPTTGSTGVYVERDTTPAFSSAYTVMDWTKNYSFINVVPIAGLYYYQIKFRNQDGIVTATYNESITVASDPPQPQEPSGLLAGGRYNPTSLGGPVTFSAVHSHPGLPVPAVEALIEVDNDQDFLSTHWDSGWLGISPVSSGARSQEINYGGPALEYGERYYWRIKLKNDVPQETPWSSESAWFVPVQYWQELPYKGYHLLNIPCYSNKTIGELIGDDLSLIWIFKYDEITRSWVQVFAGDTFENNVGYFAYCNNPGEIAGFNGEDIGGGGPQVIALTYTSIDGFGNDGWNLVRNPFAKEIYWSDCILDNCDTVHYRPWGGTQYEWYNTSGPTSSPGGSNTIPPGASFWVHATDEVGGTLTILDPGPAPAPREAGPTGITWRVPVSVYTGAHMDTATYFSVREGADEQHDSYDVLEMNPFTTKYIQAYFNHPEWGYYAARYTQDTRPLPAADDSIEWRLTVYTNNASEIVNVSWTVPPEIREDWDFYMRDETTGEIIDLEVEDLYQYAATVVDTRDFTFTAVRLNAFESGDVDRDGSVTDADALLAARSEHGLETLMPEQLGLADMDSDGKVGVLDALLIRKRVRDHLPPP
ncbi:MAG: hypothetical protein E3J72_13635 [Planctomycetota bacterium]|nr:MAG: hypothetical protein E3J72_13635 [Planctomycetota bacterium]